MEGKKEVENRFIVVLSVLFQRKNTLQVTKIGKNKRNKSFKRIKGQEKRGRKKNAKAFL